jgi:hypothetical protein
MFWKLNIENIKDVNKNKIDKKIHELINKLLINSEIKENEEFWT